MIAKAYAVVMWVVTVATLALTIGATLWLPSRVAHSNWQEQLILSALLSVLALAVLGLVLVATEMLLEEFSRKP